MHYNYYSGFRTETSRLKSNTGLQTLAAVYTHGEDRVGEQLCRKGGDVVLFGERERRQLLLGRIQRSCRLFVPYFIAQAPLESLACSSLAQWFVPCIPCASPKSTDCWPLLLPLLP